MKGKERGSGNSEWAGKRYGRNHKGSALAGKVLLWHDNDIKNINHWHPGHHGL